MCKRNVFWSILFVILQAIPVMAASIDFDQGSPTTGNCKVNGSGTFTTGPMEILTDIELCVIDAGQVTTCDSTVWNDTNGGGDWSGVVSELPAGTYEVFARLTYFDGEAIEREVSTQKVQKEVACEMENGALGSSKEELMQHVSVSLESVRYTSQSKSIPAAERQILSVQAAGKVEAIPERYRLTRGFLVFGRGGKGNETGPVQFKEPRFRGRIAPTPARAASLDQFELQMLLHFKDTQTGTVIAILKPLMKADQIDSGSGGN